MTPEEARAEHDMYFHLWVVADRCAVANDDDWPRRRAAWRVRDFCKDAMRECVAGEPRHKNDALGRAYTRTESYDSVGEPDHEPNSA